MASKLENKKTSSPFHLLNDLGGLIFLFLFCFTLLSLLSYSALDPSFFTSVKGKAQNLGGMIGSHWSSLLWQSLGLASFVFSLVLLLASIGLFRRIEKKTWALAAINYALLLISASATASLVAGPVRFGGSRFSSGGLAGELMGGFFSRYLNTTGATLLCLFLFVFAISLSIRMSVKQMALYSWLAVSVAGSKIFSFLFRWGTKGASAIGNSVVEGYEEIRPSLLGTVKSGLHQFLELFRSAKSDSEPLPKTETKVEAPQRSPCETKAPTPALRLVPTQQASATESSDEPEIIYSQKKDTSSVFDAPGEMDAPIGAKSADSAIMGFVKKAVRENERSVKAALGKKIQFELPPLSFLHTPIAEENKLDREELLKNSRMLEEKFADFNVKGQVTAVKPGPVVTMYEFKPAPGVKVSAVANLADDLALSLSAKSIRIVAPIPGRDVIGIEVPNKKRESVLLKEILAADTFASRNHSIPIAIGKDILGVPVVADLKKMPHLLVAGTTGSGKSVFINTLICSLLYKSSPEDLNLILVDPKQLELAPYNDIPHLLLPVVTEPKKASLALSWAVQEMERRYRIIAASVTRDQEGYNAKLAELGTDKMGELINRGREDFEEKLTAQKMPKLVIIIDELADLMMTAKSDVENNICRLAQKARAAGVHLVLATQRPSTDVITGLIKANLPSRICFKVSSKVDSRVMFDAMGAEKLIGMGDMLFMPPGESSLVRMHGAYLSVEEVDQITQFWRAQGKPEYRDDILIDPEEDGVPGAFSDADTADPVYQQSLEIAYSTGSVSASYLQRRLRIGYNKAARYVEMMEAQGIVGPADGAKPRPILGPRP